MVFNISVGLSGLTNKEAKESSGKTYALYVGDTVMVNEGGAATLITTSKKKVKHIGIFLKDEDDDEEEEEEEEEEKEGNLEMYGRGKRTTVLENRTRVSDLRE